MGSRRLTLASLVLTVGACAAQVALPSPAFAAANNFLVNNADNNWNNPDNWSDGVPTADDDVSIPSGESVTLSTGTDGVANSLTLQGALTISGRTLTLGDGDSTFAGSLFDLTNGATLNLSASTTWSQGSIRFGGGSTVNVGASDVLNITANTNTSHFTPAPGDPPNRWHNEGTVNRTTSTGTAQINQPFENDGVVNVDIGTLNLGLPGGGTGGESAGDYSIDNGATLVLDGTHDIIGVGASVEGLGTFKQSQGTTVVGGGATFGVGALDFELSGVLQLDSNGSAGSIALTGSGTRSGAGTLTLNTIAIGPPNIASAILTLSGVGTTTVTDTATFGGSFNVQVFDGHTLNLAPTSTWSTGSIGFRGGTVNIGPGDVLNITGGSTTSIFTGPLPNLLANEGTVNRAAAGTTSVTVPLTNTGTINVDTGTLNVAGGLTQTAGTTEIDSGATLGGAVSLQGGVLKGAGSASGTVTNSGGTVKPGASPGVLSMGAYTQQSGGTLEVEIAGTTPGTEHDRVAVTGNASLAGTLSILNDPNFTPSAVDIMTVGGSSLTGCFNETSTLYDVQCSNVAPRKVTLVPAGADPDDDGDGVPDTSDQCPDTPLDERPVDANGCSEPQRDDDDDDVINRDDLCPNTPLDERPVDANGCSEPQRDDDGDDVINRDDLCPNTPPGEPVNADGCSESQLANPCANPTIEGTAAGEEIFGTAAADVIDGKGGNDTIKGKKGNDIICGGDGNDVIKGGRGSDTIFGQDGNDTLLGGRGKDALNGGAGDDTLKGGRGADALDGGNDTDVCGGGPGADTVANCP